MSHAPPVARLAIAYAAGVSCGLVGAPVWAALLAAIFFLAAPTRASGRPRAQVWWPLLAVVGVVSTAASGPANRCGALQVGESVELRGRFLAGPRTGAAPFAPRQGCGPVTVVLADTAVPAGLPVLLSGSWRAGRTRPWFQAREIEYAHAESSGPEGRSWGSSGGGPGEWRWLGVRWRDGLARRLERLYGPQAPVVAALTLARREGLSTELRETFASTGIAHLLAISGFHVAVVAGVLLALLRMLGVARPRALVWAAGLAWMYVALIGFPDAACRAALILTVGALSRARGLPGARWGSLGAALLILLAVDPEKLASPGFQLSFAGAAGLVAWSAPVSAAVRRLTGGRCPRSLAMGVGAGVAATAATLPVVAWHFERVSLVGIPVTLAATPFVSVALPGALASLAVDFVAPDVATFLAGGVSVMLRALEVGAGYVARLSWVSAWTSRGTVIAGMSGLVVAAYSARHPRVHARGRRLLAPLYVTASLVAWPLILTLQGWGSLEVVMIDVGQGDAIAVRTPRGRWLLVDTGPEVDAALEGARPDPGRHPVVRALRARGVSRLEVLVLTHPDLDHIGGAVPVLSTFDVGAVYDPILPAPKASYAAVLATASDRGVTWSAASAGHTLEIDGVIIDVLYPDGAVGPTTDANAASVVLRLSFGDFDALLTGDAYVDVERELLETIGQVELLKVGHHGSDTSTDSLLLESARPEVALISVGRRNRYGHPSPRVLGRLDRFGVRVHRTDQEGTISVLAHRDGTYFVRSERAATPATAGRDRGR